MTQSIITRDDYAVGCALLKCDIRVLPANTSFSFFLSSFRACVCVCVHQVLENKGPSTKIEYNTKIQG